MLCIALGARDLVRDVLVPDFVEVVVRAGVAEADWRDLVATAVRVLDVQRLVDVADEVDDVLQSLLAGGCVGAGIQEEVCLVRDGVDYAAVLVLGIGAVLRVGYFAV